MAYLALVRHGKSEWNKLGQWTGWTDVSLCDEGQEEARKAAQGIKDIKFDITLTSKLKRAKETLDIIKQELGITVLPSDEHEALNERDYGLYTGKNKWQVKEDVGEEEFIKIRRGFEQPIPQGETMKDVYNRVVTCYRHHILPSLKEGKNILIGAHGNSLRALVMFLEALTPDQLEHLEIGTGEVYLYTFDESGNIVKKEIRSENENKGKI